LFKIKSNTVQKIDAIEATLTTDACYNSENEVNFIEQVEIVVSIQAPVRGNLEIFLTSPMGTSALILPVSLFSKN
jgi:subtilisin-like proprotein convertase family protein